MFLGNPSTLPPNVSSAAADVMQGAVVIDGVCVYVAVVVVVSVAAVVVAVVFVVIHVVCRKSCHSSSYCVFCCC